MWESLSLSLSFFQKKSKKVTEKKTPHQHQAPASIAVETESEIHTDSDTKYFILYIARVNGISVLMRVCMWTHFEMHNQKHHKTLYFRTKYKNKEKEKNLTEPKSMARSLRVIVYLYTMYM